MWRLFSSCFLSCAAHSLYTLSGERVHHTQQTLLPNTRLAGPACYTMATFSEFCLRAFAASSLESAVKKVGGSGGGRDGGGGGRGLGGRRCRGVCPCLCVGGVARRGSGRAAGTNRKAGRKEGRSVPALPGLARVSGLGTAHLMFQGRRYLQEFRCKILVVRGSFVVKSFGLFPINLCGPDRNERNLVQGLVQGHERCPRRTKSCSPSRSS